jgi:DNA-3-methyladenine glycosylase II
MNFNKARKHLSKDPVMKKLISDYGELPWEWEVDIFSDIVGSIISQQLSVKAADTIQKRFIALLPGGKMTPESILTLTNDAIRECGISRPKIKYIKGVAQAVEDGTLNIPNLSNLSDRQVLIELTKLKGIGQWTGEMLLMFSLKRPDVFSMGDLGVRNAMAKLYDIDRDDFLKIEEISMKWKPYRTLACRYLWKSLDNSPKVKI